MPEHDLPESNLEIINLERPKPSDPGKPAFLSAQVLPGRGMMTLQIRALLPRVGETDLLYAPSSDRAREMLGGGPRDFPGNPSYLIGGAVLIPYANRIRGALSPDGKTVETRILGKTVHLPANAGGRRPGAEQYAMHGLVLDAPMDEVRRRTSDEEDAVVAFLQAGDFGGRWPSAAELTFENVLRSDSFNLTIRARNVGSEPLPMGIGWHPYFNLPSGRRGQARMHIPARSRALVNDYDEVLPTGEVVPVAGTPYDFSMPGGKPLGNLYLDDCFVDLQGTPGQAVAEVVDGEAAYGLRVVAASPPIRAFQVYGPPEKDFIVLEPQFNWADPFGAQWGPGVDTGMAVLEPGESVVYSARLELFVP
ncbi:MAG TPA: aldose 1-epimerase [Thermoanaerobaculia bacterium]|nr:aldose 1-epimerase [Thermoanaerobaculia bacterium]